MTKQVGSFKNMYSKELKLKDIIINNYIEEISKLNTQINQLQLKLRIPKLQREFLEQKGALDNFVTAKL